MRKTHAQLVKAWVDDCVEFDLGRTADGREIANAFTYIESVFPSATIGPVYTDTEGRREEDGSLTKWRKITFADGSLGYAKHNGKEMRVGEPQGHITEDVLEPAEVN